MLSNAPAVLIAKTETSLGFAVASQLASAGIPTLLTTSPQTPTPVPPNFSTVILDREDAASIPQVFDTGHSIRTVVLGIPTSVEEAVLAGMRIFVDLANVEGVKRLILLGNGGSGAEHLVSYLKESGVSFEVLRHGNVDKGECHLWFLFLSLKLNVVLSGRCTDGTPKDFVLASTWFSPAPSLWGGECVGVVRR